MLHRIIHEKGDFRAAIVDTTKIGRKIFSEMTPSPIALQLITQGLTGALLMTTNLKNEGVLSFNFKGDGPGGTLTVEANSQGEVRGTMHDINVNFEPDKDVDLFVQAIGEGNLSVNRKVGPGGKIYDSVVPMLRSGVAMNFANYLLQSEQINAGVQVGAKLDADHGVAGSGGVIIQALPGADQNILFILEQRMLEMASLGDIFSQKDGIGAVRKWLFDDMEIKTLETRSVRYFCGCTRQRMLQMLATLAIKDLQEMNLKRQGFDIDCSFCNKTFPVVAEDLDVILDMKANPA